MQNNPEVSVAMCTYNGSLYLREQLDSVIIQTYPIKELIIFDDASTDNTKVILQSYAERYSFIKLYFNSSNLGFTKNFEQAVKKATASVIAIADQDDIWINTKIEKMINAWDINCPLIYCGGIMFSDKKPKVLKPHPYYRHFEGTDARKIFLRNTVSGHALMFRKDFLQIVLPFKKGIMYDWWMAANAAYNGGIQFYNEILVMQREHSNNITLDSGNKYTKREKRTLNKKQVIEHCNAFQNVTKMPEQHKKFARDLSDLMQKSLDKKIYVPLLFFLFRNRNILFNYKKRSIDFFSHAKHSYRRTIN